MSETPLEIHFSIGLFFKKLPNFMRALFKLPVVLAWAVWQNVCAGPVT
jgi:hypothetical protein